MKLFLSTKLLVGFLFIVLTSNINSPALAQSENVPAIRTERVRRAAAANPPAFRANIDSELTTDRTDTSPVANARRAALGESTGEEERSIIPLPNTMQGLNDKRPLGVGDKLSFKVVEDEVAAKTLVITDSAELDVPYIGRIPVNNKTCKQLAYYIKGLLEREYYFQATVIIGLDSAGTGARAVSRGKIYVMGQVRSPGPQELPVDETFTVSKGILRAGGFGPYANKKKVKLVRGGKAGASAKPEIIDCAEIIDKGRWDKDVEVNPDDIITVPEKIINIF